MTGTKLGDVNGRWTALFKIVNLLVAVLLGPFIALESWQTYEMIVVKHSRFTKDQGSSLTERVVSLERTIPTEFPPQDFLKQWDEFRGEVKDSLHAINRELAGTKTNVALLRQEVDRLISGE